MTHNESAGNSLGIPDVIGQGTYGCVHKPQMKCKNKTRKNKMNVSKVMTNKNADGELQEYKTIASVDTKKNLYLGQPTKCNIDEIELNRKAIAKCRNKNLIPSKLEDYSLLIMKDGGKNLEQFANYVHKNWDNTPGNKKKMELFWLETSRLFMGLKVFQDNKILHHDLKHQNIVYNEKLNRLNFIDFGFMTKKDLIVQQAKNSLYMLATDFHWSFPWEFAFINYDSYKYISKNSRTMKEREYYVEQINNNCQYFFKSILPTNLTSDEYQLAIQKMLKQFYVMLIELEPKDYEKFLNKSIDTFDSYGVGIALLYVLNRTGKFIDNDLFEKLGYLFVNMVSPNVYSRYSVDELLHQYENIMLDSGLLEKHKKSYYDHILVKGTPIPATIQNDISNISKESFMIPRNKIIPTEISTKRLCPDGKEYKVSTKRCVNKCKDGYTRDANFKCIKDRTQKKYKICPKGKQRNPLTNRCVKDCKPGYLRDKTFKCRKGFNPFASM